MKRLFKREPLTNDEANRLANACNGHEEKLIIWTLLDTGLRLREFASLNRNNIDWQAHRLIVHGKGGPYGKRSKRRVVPMSNRVKPLLEGHFSLHETMGISPRTIQRVVNRVANRAHIARECTPHVLRHSMATFALQRGISLHSLQKILGHDHLTTTAIYLNISPEEAVKEYEEKW